MKYLLTILLTMLIVFTSALTQAQTGVVNINTADTKTLTQLERIGPKYAERIVKYRETNGPFKKAKDIQNVSGIGSKTFEINKGRIIVSEPAPEDSETKPENKNEQ